MNYKVFIPVTDEMLYEHPELITAPLRPYQIDHPCFHWMATIESPEQSTNDPRVNMRFDHRIPLVPVVIPEASQFDSHSFNQSLL